MTRKVQDRQITRVRHLLELMEAQERLQPTSAEEWLLQATGDRVQLREDIATLVGAGVNRAMLIRDLREVWGLAGTKSSNSTLGIILRMEALAAELQANVLSLPWETSDLAGLLLNGAAAIARHQHRSEQRQEAVANLTRRVDEQIGLRSHLSKKACRAILSRLLAWATEPRWTHFAQGVAASGGAQFARQPPPSVKTRTGSDKRAQGWQVIPTTQHRLRAQRAADSRQ